MLLQKGVERFETPDRCPASAPTSACCSRSSSFPSASRRRLRRDSRRSRSSFPTLGTRDSTHAVPGFFLSRSAEALALIDEVDADNLKLQYDLFHMRIMGDDLAKTIEANLGRIGHMQVADVPDRHQPGTGEIDFPPLFDLVDRLGWPGWVGAEYIPAGRTEDGLAWVKKYL